jgi:hypothetical protein
MHRSDESFTHYASNRRKRPQWLALWLIRLNYLEVSKFDGLSELIAYCQTCGKPIEALSLGSVSMKKYPEKVE